MGSNLGPRQNGWTNIKNKSPKIGILGAGFSGICAAVQLQREMNFDDFVIIDENEDFGGTWLCNDYPGCACDVQSHLYSFSFEPNPNWSSNYAPQPEIWEYLKSVAKKYGLYEKARFNCHVQSAAWDGQLSAWKVQILDKATNTVEEVIFPYVISCVGALRYPNIPKQFDDFKGPKFHSVEWDYSVDLKNKKVAVIGSGASAIQIVPSIVDEIGPKGELHSYQRKPGWVNPKSQYKFPSFVKWLFAYVPLIMWIYRCYIFLKNDQRHMIFTKNRIMTWLGYRVATKYMEETLEPHLHEKLQPKYELGCKRVLISDDYFQAFNKPYVHVHRDAITKVSKDSITTADGVTQKIDVLILATGFRVQDFFSPLKLYGRNGKNLIDLWDNDRPYSYYGIVANELPNAFMVLGPNTGLGHNSIIFMLECQVNFILQVLREAMGRNARVVVLKEGEDIKWTEEVDDKFKNTVWATSCASWYANRRGTITTLWPKTCTSYYFGTKKVDFNKFEFIQ